MPLDPFRHSVTTPLWPDSVASLLTGAQMKEADRRTIEEFGIPSLVLMERASLEATRLIASSCERAPVAVLAAGGNNGGDGVAIGRMLDALGWHVEILMTAPADRRTAECQHQVDLAKAAGLKILPLQSTDVTSLVARSRVLVDALVGIGLEGVLRGRIAELLRDLRSARREDHIVFAVDIPSGVHAATGTVGVQPLRADHTLALAAPKWGHVLDEGLSASGTLHVLDIGIPAEFLLGPDTASTASRAAVGHLLRPMDAGGHKGTTGTLEIFAGSHETPGAALLSTLAARRTGAGLTVICAPAEIQRMVIAGCPEAVAGPMPRTSGAVLLGPGFGTDAARELLGAEFDKKTSVPLVVDADGLTAMVELEGAKTAKRPLVLTPHPGELARMLHTSTEDVTSDLPGATRALAARYGATVVAKTAGAVIGAPDGSLSHVLPGSPGMAKGGSGDVLAGMIASLCLRHDSHSAALVGTVLHSLAGGFAAEKLGPHAMAPTDIVAHIPSAIRALTGHGDGICE